MNLKDYINQRIEEFDIFEPIAPSYNYECSNIATKSYVDFDYENFLDENYNIYNNLHKEVLGKDQSGKYNIYEYRYISPVGKYNIAISAGMHGVELGGILGLSWFIYNILHSDERGFKFIRENCSITFIPILNPWGVSQSPLNYGNCNQVNLNKNFKYRGLNSLLINRKKEDNTWDYAGDIDNPEQETLIFKDWIASKCNYNLYIDCHSAVQKENGEYKDGTLFYGYCTPAFVLSDVEYENDRIEKFYSNRYNIKKRGYYLGTKMAFIKNAFIYDNYNIPTLSIEQINSYDELDWSGNNGDNNAVKNYVLMMRSYILKIISRR